MNGLWSGGVKFSQHSTLLLGLRAYWKLDETSGTRFDTRNVYNLSPVSTPGYAVGKIGNAYSGDGTAKYLRNTTHAGGLDSTPVFYYAFWMYPNVVNADQSVIDKSWNNEHMFRLRTTGRAEWFVRDSGGLKSVSPAFTYTAATWYFIEVYASGALGTIGLAVNGGAFATTAIVSNPTVPVAGSQLGIGGSFSGYFNGRIDEVGLWNRIPSAAERARLFNV